MSASIEAITKAQLPESEVTKSVERLPGGISSQNYKVITENSVSGEPRTFVITTFSDPRSWWKIGKEYYLRKIFGVNPDIPIPKLYGNGSVSDGDEETRYLLREFIEGEDLDTAINHRSVQQSPLNWESLNYQLGFILGTIHAHTQGFYGLIRSGEDDHDHYRSWADYISSQLQFYAQSIERLNGNETIGAVTAHELKQVQRAAQKDVHPILLDLNSTSSPTIAHGDMRLGNVIAGNNLEVASVIDWEWSVSGDPEIDLAFLENWLFFSSYSEPFYHAGHALLQGYQQRRNLSKEYFRNRRIYHAYRSLDYLSNMFTQQDWHTINDHPLLSVYTSQHFQILRCIAEGRSLDEIGIIGVNNYV